MRGLAGLLTGAAAALIPAGGVNAQAVQARGEPAAFAPPAGPVTLKRVLSRELRDGKAIVVTRRFRLVVVPEGGGYSVVATPLDVRVDAPPMLAPLARIERERGDAAFELRLDARGLIVDSRAGDHQAARARLAAQGEAVLAAAISAPAERGAAQGILGQLLGAMGTTALPADFFNPRAGEQREHRQLALPDGSTGEIDIVLAAELPAGGGLPRRYSREVVTTLAGTRHTSREDYSLEPG